MPRCGSSRLPVGLVDEDVSDVGRLALYLLFQHRFCAAAIVDEQVVVIGTVLPVARLTGDIEQVRPGIDDGVAADELHLRHVLEDVARLLQPFGLQVEASDYPAAFVVELRVERLHAHEVDVVAVDGDAVRRVVARRDKLVDGDRLQLLHLFGVYLDEVAHLGASRPEDTQPEVAFGVRHDAAGHIFTRSVEGHLPAEGGRVALHLDESRLLVPETAHGIVELAVVADGFGQDQRLQRGAVIGDVVASLHEVCLVRLAVEADERLLVLDENVRFIEHVDGFRVAWEGLVFGLGAFGHVKAEVLELVGTLLLQGLCVGNHENGVLGKTDGLEGRAQEVDVIAVGSHAADPFADGVSVDVLEEARGDGAVLVDAGQSAGTVRPVAAVEQVNALVQSRGFST